MKDVDIEQYNKLCDELRYQDADLCDLKNKLQLCVCRLYDAELITGSRACELLGGIKMQDFIQIYQSGWQKDW